MNDPQAVGFGIGILWRRLRAVGDDNDGGGAGRPASYRVYIPAHPAAPRHIDDVTASLTPDFPTGPHQLWHEAAMLTAIMERRFAVDEGRKHSLLLGPYRHYYINDLFLRLYEPDPDGGGGGGGGGGGETWTLEFPTIIDGDQPPWTWPSWDAMLDFPPYLAEREEYWRFLTDRWIGDLGADGTVWMRPDEDPPPTIEPPNIGAPLTPFYLPMFNNVDWEEHSDSIRAFLLPKRERPAPWDIAEYEDNAPVPAWAVQHPVAVPRRLRGNILGWLTRALFSGTPDFCAGAYEELDEDNPNYDPDYEGPFHLYEGSNQSTHSVEANTSALDTTAKIVAKVKSLVAANRSWTANAITNAYAAAMRATPTRTDSRLLARAGSSCTWSLGEGVINITITTTVAFTRHVSADSPHHAYIDLAEKTGGIPFSKVFAYTDATARATLEYSGQPAGWGYYDRGVVVADPDIDAKTLNFANALRQALPLDKEPIDVTPSAAEISANGPFVVDVMPARPELGYLSGIRAFLAAVADAAATSRYAYATCWWQDRVYLPCDMDFRTFMLGSDLPVVWGREQEETDDAGAEHTVDRRVHTPSWGGPGSLDEGE